MKHHVRREAWLAACRRRLDAIRQGRTQKLQRRLRYFTFCAIGAVDVLLLDLEKIIRRSSDGWFDTVFFFNRSDSSVLETRKNIPGATGFPGDFIKIALINDPEESDAPIEDPGLPAEAPNVADRRGEINRLSTHRDFVAAFPFDVMNFDLEGYLFRPSDHIPGDLIRALRKAFEWQKRPLRIDGRPDETITGFTLLFTTKIGPANMGADFVSMLRDTLNNNLQRDGKLIEFLNARTGLADAASLQVADFEEFFKLAAPKILAQALLESDWYVDDTHGIQVFEFERATGDGGAYRMLHMVMDVRRHEPPQERRAPGARSEVADRAYEAVVRRLFENAPSRVTLEAVDTAALDADLDRIEEHRRRYRSGEADSTE